MTNLNQLIERRQGEAHQAYQQVYKGILPAEVLAKRNVWYEEETTQTATEAYRQALQDVLARLPGDKEHLNYDSDERGHNTTLQTVRAQIDDLLGKI
jgi:hypothetical protein